MWWGGAMRNIFLIARREYVERVRSKSFIIMTLLIPALMFAITAVPAMLATRGGGGAKHFMIVASDTQTAEAIRQQLEELTQKRNTQANDSVKGRKRNL